MGRRAYDKAVELLKQALAEETDPDKQQQIRLPQTAIGKRANIQQMRGQLAKVEDIAKQVNLTEAQVVDLEKTARVTTLIDESHDYQVDDASESAHASHFAGQLLDSLDALGKFVLSARFGIGYSGRIHSYEELSILTSLSVNEIVAIEAKALGHLRQASQQV
jgi:DNA-directed RNA polymerase sigma subunit (sigma70/sigma32)